MMHTMTGEQISTTLNRSQPASLDLKSIVDRVLRLEAESDQQKEELKQRRAHATYQDTRIISLEELIGRRQLSAGAKSRLIQGNQQNAQAHERSSETIPADIGEFESLEKRISESRSLLALGDDWDECGALPVSRGAWERSVAFLRRHALWLLDHYGCVINPPQILPGPGDSVDLHWDEPSYEMLINFPSDPNALAGFYGDDRAMKTLIKGKFDPASFNQGLLVWLAKIP